MTRGLLATLALLLIGCGGPAAFTVGPESTPAPPSGISGMVVLGPTCPTGSAPGAHDPVPCLTPYSASLVILNGENDVVARLVSAADGSFRADLPPGDYVIAPQGGDPFPVAQPIPVRVTAGEYFEVEINFDTGIR
ncbi:hypothetical protein BH24CHL6_BH24CHL6_03240 [soil metagenome]